MGNRGRCDVGSREDGMGVVWVSVMVGGGGVADGWGKFRGVDGWGGSGVEEGRSCWAGVGDVVLAGLWCCLVVRSVVRLIGSLGRDGVNVDGWGRALLVGSLFLHRELCRPCRPLRMRWQWRHLAIPYALRM